MATIEELRARIDAEGMTQDTYNALHAATTDGDITINQARQLMGMAPITGLSSPADKPIPLPEVRQLDLKPGDRLAVILPDGIVSQRAVSEFAQRMEQQLDTYVPEVRAIVFPHGTDLAIVRRDPRIPASTPDTVLSAIDNLVAPYRELGDRG